jgi:hypothetical protein
LGQSIVPAPPGPDPKDYAISLELKHPFDPPGPPAVRELARHRYEVAAADFTTWWEFILEGHGYWVYRFVVRSSLQLMEAQAATSLKPEVQLDALEGHLQRMLFADHFRWALWNAGLVCVSNPISPFPWAVLDTKFRLAKAIFALRAKSPPGPDELERLWIELGCRDTAHACRVRWEIQSAGAAAEDFLCQHLSEPIPEEDSPEQVIFGDERGELWVERDPQCVVGSDKPERDEENAARHRRWQRARDLLREMLEEPDH